MNRTAEELLVDQSFDEMWKGRKLAVEKGTLRRGYRLGWEAARAYIQQYLEDEAKWQDERGGGLPARSALLAAKDGLEAGTYMEPRV